MGGAQVLKESLRLHPPVGLFGRACPQGIKLGEYEFSGPAAGGTPVIALVNLTAVHRHPRYWHEPARFLPERFGSNKSEDDDADGDGDGGKGKGKAESHPFQWVPFSAGPRNCIGQRFAMLEATVLLAAFLQRFAFALEDGAVEAEVEEAITCRPRHGLGVYLTNRPPPPPPPPSPPPRKHAHDDDAYVTPPRTV